MKNFALIGIAGYIAVKHLNAIKSTKNKLLLAYDISDNVGILDSFFPDSLFFTNFNDFKNQIIKYNNTENKIDYISICSPNYTHFKYILFGIKYNMNVICEKPLVLNNSEINKILEIQKKTNYKIYCILQLRLHKKIKELKNQIESNQNKIYQVNLNYITARGNWYHNSWKGNVLKSGGIATNIGIHFFDILIWIFGDVKENIILEKNTTKNKGLLKLEKANINWFLSIDYKDIPQEIKQLNQRAFRFLSVDNQEIDFTIGFDNLHVENYENILLENTNFLVSETQKSIELVNKIRYLDI